jgi:hypothetical protein
LGFFAFLGVDQHGNPAANFPDLFARRYRFFTFKNVLAEVQGIFTFPPQQMPHASTYIKNALLEFAGEMPLLSGVWRSRRCWDVSNADGENGANKVYGKFTASLMMNKLDVVAFIHPLWGVTHRKLARINKLAVSLK